MIEHPTFALFLLTSVVLLLTPGPAVLYIVTRSVDQGRGAGVVSALGIGVGSLFHVAAATLGMSALLVSSSLAFAALKYLGAAYLVYLGIQKLREREPPEHQQGPPPAPRKRSRIFWQGVVVNLLNPKVALFFFAFLPQFTDPSRGTVAGQLLLLGCLFVAMGIVSDSLYALLAGSIGHRLKRSWWSGRGQHRLVGGVYLSLGVATALSGSGAE
ncbi:MAG: LysE family translocator [Chloroflexaceae bacterium]|nr:LysE family translocator [Chloroflexaceae bacterium]